MRTLSRFTCKRNPNRKTLETLLAQAVFAVECTHGQSGVRLAAAYSVTGAGKASMLIDVSTEIGEQIARVFVGLLTRQLGEDGFTVERIHADECDFKSSKMV